MDEVIKPCPFCRSGRAPGFGGYTQAYFSGGVELIEENRSPPSFYVWCGSCGSKGPPERTAAEAIAAWNTRADAAPTPNADEVEAVARAISAARGLTPDSLYAHHEWEDWPVDKRDEYVGLDGEVRVNLMHYAWRHHTDTAQAAIAALDAARGKAEPVPFAWATWHDPPMLFLSYDDARLYCDDDEDPIPLYELERGEPFNG